MMKLQVEHRDVINMYLPSLKLTCSHLKNGWLEFGNTILSYWVSACVQRLCLLVSGRVVGG